MDVRDETQAISAPRYTGRPFPPYRFLPGRHPHPAGPQGHSYRPPGTAHDSVEYQPPDRWKQSENYLYGCDLYNNAFWWEAHEAWEDLWRLCPKDSPQRRWLQGVIQVAACHLKLRLRGREAVGRLRESSRAHLAFVRDRIEQSVFMGADVPGFIERVERYYNVVLARPGPPLHDPAIFPYLLPGDPPKR